MQVCFICNKELQYDKPTQICSSVSSITNEPLSERIAEVVGEDFIIVITPYDYTCDRCTELLQFIDKTKNDLNLIRKALIYYIQKKHKLLPDENSTTMPGVNF